MSSSLISQSICSGISSTVNRALSPAPLLLRKRGADPFVHGWCLVPPRLGGWLVTLPMTDLVIYPGLAGPFYKVPHRPLSMAGWTAFNTDHLLVQPLPGLDSERKGR